MRNEKEIYKFFYLKEDGRTYKYEGKLIEVTEYHVRLHDLKSDEILLLPREKVEMRLVK